LNDHLAGAELRTIPSPSEIVSSAGDQYNFISKGVPAVAMGVGCKLDTPQQKVIGVVAQSTYEP
jgi:hypothetical protein